MKTGIRQLCAVALCCAAAVTAAAVQAAVDHGPWSTLLSSCVSPTAGGGSTVVDYPCFRERRGELDAYLDTLSSVQPAEFSSWARDTRLAFLINAYNAWTVDLILSAYPDLESIRDLGSLFRSPWKKAFIPLLGKTISLDEIEHGMIREPGSYDDPRIHFAVNCASIGCPALRREAYTAAALETQLEAQTEQFLGDRSRNRLRENTLELSSIFKWYRDDFRSGWRGSDSLAAFLARYRGALNLSDTEVTVLLAGGIDIDFLDYDWRLNDAPATAAAS